MIDLTFTYDAEDNRPDINMEQRFDRVTLEVLDALQEAGVRGTFFIVATAARSAPALVKEIAARGHEVALHSYDHVMLPDQTEEAFARETQEGKSILEDLLATDVVGYRAPNFSLTAGTPWAYTVLEELGFRYSSSVLPAPHPYYGYAGAPQEPFRWPSGLLELPAPIATFGTVRLPFLGGTYFRLLPAFVVKNRAKRFAGSSGCWFYAHPHDFDYDEPLYRIRNVSWFVTLMLRIRRRGNLQRMMRFLASGEFNMAPPFAEQVAEGRFAGAVPFAG